MAALLLLAATPAAQAEFCESQVIHDYAKPLKGLRALPAAPLDEHLDFAPARVFLGHYPSGPLQLGPAERGFYLGYSPPSEGNPASPRIGWEVTTRLVQIDRRGRRRAPAQTIERHIKRIPEGGVDLRFDVPGKAAIYRLEVVFENGKEERLARFGEYFRVLRPSLDVDFALNGSSFHRGDRVQAYLVNRGASFLSFGLDRTIQYYDGSAWISPPGSWKSGVVPAIGLSIGPGVETTCWAATVPSDAGLGTYRFVKTVDHSTSIPFEPSTPLEVSSEFSVAE